MKRMTFALVALCLALTGQAQAQYVPYFPQTLPSGTVVGRVTSGAGPAEAIPTSTLLRALTAGTFTQGSVLYAGANGYLSQDNSTFFWDLTNKRLGLGTALPSYLLHLYNGSGAAQLMLEGSGSSAQLMLLNRSYSTNATNVLSITQGTTGLGIIATQGSTVLTLAPGTIAFQGTSSGAVSLTTQASAGTWNFNLPTTAGTAGQFLTSGGGGSTAMTWGSAVLGSTTNDNAASGYVGETITASVASGSAVSLTTNTSANVTSVSLTAGDWDVCGNVLYTNNAATTTTVSTAAFSTVSATLPTAPAGGWSEWGGATLTGPSISHTVGCHRVSVASTTTYFLVTRATFATNTSAAYGSITARRRR